MSDQYGRRDDDLAYGSHPDSYGQGDESQDRGLIGDTFKKFKTRYDQHKPQQDFGYNNPSSSTVNSQYNNQSSYQYSGSGGAAGGAYNQPSSSQSTGQYGQSGYPSGSSNRPPQRKPDFADKLVGGLFGSITSIGQDVERIFVGKPSSGPQGQQNYQPGLQSNLQGPVPAAASRNRFDSTFVGPKPGNDVKWYVDGCAYMYAVSKAIESARQTIWILDWWLSPELYLRRPPARNEEWRLDKCLMRAANRGVKINVIVYKEVTQALTLSSSYTKHALEALSPNVSVFRHPDHLPDAQTAQSSIISALQGLKLDAAGAAKLGADALKGVYGITDDVILYWAHHEKLCLIDGSIAFMGGLDLCYGRWDTNQHSISDVHPSDLNKIIFPGQDYNDARIMDFSEVNQPFQNKLDRTKNSRMGWSDVSICLQGPCVGDLMHHFVDRWNFIYDEKYNVRKDKRYQRLPDFPDHRHDEMGFLATKPANQQQQSTSTQFAPPPGAGAYTQPAWQATNRPSSSSGLNTHPAQDVGPQTGVYQPGQQNLPPPPASGAPTFQSQTGQAQQYAVSQIPGGPQQQHYPPPPPGGPPNLASSGYQAGPGPANPSQGYNTVPNPTQYGQTTGSAVYQSPSQQSTATYGGGVASNTAPVSVPQPGGPNYSQPSAVPNVAGGYQPPPQSTYPNVDATHRPADGSQQNQEITQQYSQYTSPGQSTGPNLAPSGPTELPQQNSPSYQPYHGEPTRGVGGYGQQDTQSRGLDDYNDGRGASRGFDDDPYGYQEETSRGRYDRPSKHHGESRLDRYKNEAKKFAQQGQFMGHDVGKYTNLVESKVSQYSGGRINLPISPSSRGGMSCQLVRSCSKWSNGTPTEHSIQNAYIDLITNAQYFIYIENQFFITATGNQQSPVKNQIGKAIVDRVVRAHRENTPFKIIVNIPAIPAFAGDLSTDASLGTRAIMEFQYHSICRGGHSIMEKIAEQNINPMDYIRFYNLRNYDRINVTPSLKQGQQAAGMGYDDARQQYEAQLGTGYGGYGEQNAPNLYNNQSQVTPQGYGTLPQQQSAHMPPAGQAGYGTPLGSTAPPQQQSFAASTQPNTGYSRGDDYSSNKAPGDQRPGQSGYPFQQFSQSSYGQQGQYQYQQGAQAAPTTKADSWDSVASCYMLNGQDIRTVPWSGPAEAELNAFVSEELYIHSKLMIVDDSVVICGSSNLNDRSMLGTHDSEIALVISDNTPVQTTMAGRPFQATRFASSLRRFLFRKHLGLVAPQDPEQPNDNYMPVGVPNNYDWGSPEDNVVADPLSNVFQSLWNTRARTNTQVFRQAFHAVPDDNILTWTEYKEFYEYYFAKTDNKTAGNDSKAPHSRVEYGHVVPSDFPGGASQLKELLSQVKGTLVEMPLCFLQNENLAKEGLSFNSLTSELYT